MDLLFDYKIRSGDFYMPFLGIYGLEAIIQFGVLIITGVFGIIWTLDRVMHFIPAVGTDLEDKDSRFILIIAIACGIISLILIPVLVVGCYHLLQIGTYLTPPISYTDNGWGFDYHWFTLLTLMIVGLPILARPLKAIPVAGLLIVLLAAIVLVFVAAAVLVVNLVGDPSIATQAIVLLIIGIVLVIILLILFAVARVYEKSIDAALAVISSPPIVGITSVLALIQGHVLLIGGIMIMLGMDARTLGLFPAGILFFLTGFGL